MQIESQPAGREHLDRAGQLHHVLYTAQFQKEEIASLLGTARMIRELAAEPSGTQALTQVLAGKRVMHLFGQPSTRTAQSFIAAVDRLGGRSQLLTDLGNSSMAKGETVEDSVRVMAELFDALVIRHGDAEFTLRALWGLRAGRRMTPVVSAGMGPTQHVTQSLLDLLTLEDAWRSKGGVQGKRVLIVGDIARNRAARSLAFGLAICGVAAIEWVCPSEFAPDSALSSFLAQAGVQTSSHGSLSQAVTSSGTGLDAIYMTRLQQEWDTQKGAPLGTSTDFVLTRTLGDTLREDCQILHPLPRVNELPDAWDDDPRLRIWDQVNNGVWIRAAVLATVMGQHGVVHAAHQSLRS